MNIKCGAELRNELYRLYKTGKSIGFGDCKQNIYNYLND